ncbi:MULTISPECIES: cupin domain-containing protein [unclassified Bradyrhizobium]|uniref:cupin domain-containing protein n=1 Tax=unclassified Bradyrhizobium TaxID=2631580 RepID=UPI0028E23876|nr:MULTISPECIES: cupin domain-containing protein [unclassified Bradyrhizobium]
MKSHWTHRIAAANAPFTFALLFIVAMRAQAEVVRPIKMTKTELDGSIFKRKDATHDIKGANATTDVVTFTSKDAGFQTGLYQSGPLHEVDHDYPYNELLYFISGGVTLTSVDGSVMTVNAGEAVTIPRGWSGSFDTKGYTKLYVTYNPDDVKK